jgi:hypothetical protein
MVRDRCRFEEAKAIMLSVWDKVKESMRIDLWTEMPVDEMKIFFHQTLLLCQIPIVLLVTKKGRTMKDFGEYFASELRAVESDNAAVVFSLNCRLNLGLFFYLI